MVVLLSMIRIQSLTKATCAVLLRCSATRRGLTLRRDMVEIRGLMLIRGLNVPSDREVAPSLGLPPCHDATPGRDVPLSCEIT